jgi:hypothetical protein
MQWNDTVSTAFEHGAIEGGGGVDVGGAEQVA